MKNIHLLPTEKPSRLFKDDFDKYFISINIDQEQNHFKPQHIYITSDEEIKEGDWCIMTNDFGDIYLIRIISLKCIGGNEIRVLLSLNGRENTSLKDSCKKIILTTNDQLIADGVQAIDNEFLEWFIMNPSCEEVEVQKNWNYPLDKSWEYKIIIPQEEPKQEKWDKLNKELDDALEEEFGLEEPKQETLEDLLNKKANQSSRVDLDAYANGLDDGAKWQSERMYSEEDLKEAFKSCYTPFGFDRIGDLEQDFNKWFEQFKKK
jgi:hypothetical protein